MPSLCDVNFLVALSHDKHSHHSFALSYWQDQQFASEFIICRPVQMAFLRILTNRTVMQSSTFSASEAWNLFDVLMQDDRFIFKVEPEGIELLFRSITQKINFTPKLWTDAYLVAFALTAGYSIVTFDRDFKKFPNLKIELLV